MGKQFVIKEAWLLDENGNKIMEFTPLDLDDIKNNVNLENIRGGAGKNDLLDNETLKS
jgi:hypothetical protein